MTKRFCDLCGEPAVDTADFFGYVTPTENKGSIRFVVHFQWNYCTTITNVGDPYDLCSACREKCLVQLPNQIQGLMSGAIRYF